MLKAALPILLISLGMSTQVALCADEGSLDTMWSDPSVTKKAAGDESKTTAALCSLESLNHSDLIKSGGWPGIGPFKPDNGGFVDAGQNRLDIQSNNNKVTAAELRLNNQPKQTALVNLEMSTDFLLESLGAKAARISDFNSQFEKAKLKVLQSSKADPLNLSAGSYMVNLHPEADGSSADKYSFVIKVSGKDVSPDIVFHQAAQPATTEPPAATESTPAKVATSTRPTDWSQPAPNETTASTPVTAPPTRPKQTTTTAISTPSNLNFTIETKPKTTARTTTPSAPAKTGESAEDNNGWGTTKPAGKTAIASVTPTPVTPHTVPTTEQPEDTSGSGKEDLKTKFADIILNWQNVKKTAVRQKDTTELPQVLSDKALRKQSDAVKWLMDNKKYYEMTPKGVVVDKVVDLGKGQKYSVYAEVKEYSKYIDELTGKTIKITDDTYNVNYTVEKVGDRWFISDSALANTKTIANPGKTPIKK